jgi:hypothetical protein
LARDAAIDDGMTRVLVVGVPRSGTSWVGRVLGSTQGATYLGEPDNHEHNPFALRAKLGIPGWFYPAPAGEAREYARLWLTAFGLEASPGNLRRAGDRVRDAVALRLLHSVSEAQLLRAMQRPGHGWGAGQARLRLAAALGVPTRPSRDTRSIVVKSVHAPLSIEWVVERVSPVHVLVVLREPLNVLSSWLELGWLAEGSDPLGELEPAVRDVVAERLEVAPAGPDASPLARSAWLVGALTSALRTAAERHAWHAVTHESLSERPRERFPAVAERLGLTWTGESDDLVARLDRPGAGYEVTRESAGLSEIWRSRLTDAQVAEVTDMLERFRLGSSTAPEGGCP